MNSTNSHRISKNDSMGDWYENIAEQFYSKLLQEEPLERNRTHGIDLVYSSHKIEVKGIENLLQKLSTKSKRFQIRFWKIHRKHANKQLTLYSFVLFDEILFPDPLIFSVEAELVHQRIEEKPNSHWVWFPLWWILENYNPKFSCLPEN
ncbi:MAG: hypothetical protein ACFE9L_03290 [Candidatus Hodarchaeota archaeon]